MIGYAFDDDRALKDLAECGETFGDTEKMTQYSEKKLQVLFRDVAGRERKRET